MAEAQTTKLAGWRKWVLVVSVGLNLLIAGLVVGAMVRGGPDVRHARFDLSVGPLARAMTDEDRAELRLRLRQSGAFEGRDRSTLRADMQTMLDILRADAFDPEGFRAVVLSQRVRLQTGQDRLLEAVVAQIDTMDTESRAAFAERLESQIRRVGHGSGAGSETGSARSGG